MKEKMVENGGTYGDIVGAVKPHLHWKLVHIHHTTHTAGPTKLFKLEKKLPFFRQIALQLQLALLTDSFAAFLLRKEHHGETPKPKGHLCRLVSQEKDNVVKPQFFGRIHDLGEI